MNYDTIKNLNLKYELIDKNKSYSYNTDDGTHPSLPRNIYIN